MKSSKGLLFIALVTLPVLGVGRGDLPDRIRTLFGITIGKSNLTDVQKIGQAQIGHHGDAAGSELVVCFQTREGLVVFASNSEMAADGEVTDIRINWTESELPSCESESQGRPVAFKNGLKLGLAETEVIKIFGRPAEVSGNLWHYTWLTQVLFEKSHPYYERWIPKKDECFDGKDPFFDVSSTISLQFKNGKVNAISIKRIESVC